MDRERSRMPAHIKDIGLDMFPEKVDLFMEWQAMKPCVHDDIQLAYMMLRKRVSPYEAARGFVSNEGRTESALRYRAKRIIDSWLKFIGFDIDTVVHKLRSGEEMEIPAVMERQVAEALKYTDLRIVKRVLIHVEEKL